MPQPVVSSRYLFLCSPPKIVLAFKPDSRATFRKVTPRSSACGSCFGDGGFCESEAARNRPGRARASTLSNESTSAERLSDFKKERREGNKIATWRAGLC